MDNIVNMFLDRIYRKPTYTIGNISIGTEFFCNSLEDTDRDLNKDGDLEDEGECKVYGETAIPYGRHRVIVTWSPKLKRELPLILDVKHFTGIRMHKVATAKGTLGCVGMGMNTAKGRLTDGKYYEEKLTGMIKQWIKSGKEVYINIV